jgi:hypothetical protein
VLYANGQPARGIVVRVDRAFGLGPDETKTDKDGRFRATWIPAGRYRIVAEVFNPLSDSYRSYRTWYYPGVSVSEGAAEFLIGEGEKLDLSTWTLPMTPPADDR